MEENRDDVEGGRCFRWFVEKVEEVEVFFLFFFGLDLLDGLAMAVRAL